MSFSRFRLIGNSKKDTGQYTTAVSHGEVKDGHLKYVVEQGGNDSPPTYQEASGAPVETQSPFGYAVGAITIIFLNLSKMVGTGIYSTRKNACTQETSLLTRVQLLLSLVVQARSERVFYIGSLAT